MKQFSFLSILICIALNSFGQQVANLLQGRVIDKSGNPVSYATLRFMPSDTATLAVAEKISDAQGAFLIDLPVGHRYFLLTSCTGFTPRRQWIQIDEDALEITMAKKNDDLETVTVKATMPLITRKIDRVVVNIADNSLAAGKNSMEIMEMAPGLFVDRNGSISINGNTGVRVMIDGVMLPLSGDDLSAYLSSLRADDIKSMEIIAHPSAEYEAAGSGGLINIILKKQRSMGVSGNLSAGYSVGRYPGNDQGAQLNYHRDQLTLTGNYSHYQGKNFNDIRQSRNFPKDGQYEAENNIINRNNGHNIRLQATYDIDSTQYIALGYNGAFMKRSSITHSNSQIDYPFSSDDNFSSLGEFTSKGVRNLNNITGNYRLNTDTMGSYLQILTDYTYTHNNRSSLAVSQDLDASGQPLSDTSFRYVMPNQAKILTADIKYVKAFSPQTKLQIGGKYTQTQIDHTNRFSRVLGDRWTEAPEKYYQFLYKERITAGFFTLETRWLQTAFQLGLRAEYTQTRTRLNAIVFQENSHNYLNVFPTVFIKKDLNEKGSNNISFSYNKRIERPYYNDLNPYRSYLDNYTVETGNPNLKPQFADNFEIGFTLNNKYNLSVGYSEFTDEISQITHVSQDTSLVEITRGNYGRTKRYMATLSVPIQLTKWWRTNNTLQFRLEDVQSTGFAIKKPLYFLQTAQEFNISKTWSANLSAFYLNNAIEGNIFISKISKVDIGVEKKLIEGKLRIRAGVTDIFLGRKVRADIQYDNNLIHLSQARQSRMFKLSVTYRFAKGKSFKAKKLEVAGSDAQDRL